MTTLRTPIVYTTTAVPPSAPTALLDKLRWQSTMTVHNGLQSSQPTQTSQSSPPPRAGSTGTEQLLRQRAELPTGHPDRARLRARAIAENMALANHLARRYTGRGELFDDLAQVAALALISAVDRYDPDRPTPFAAYAVPTIVGALKRHFRDSGWGMRVPRPLQELARELDIATGELSHQRSRLPTPAELAVHLHTSVEQVLAATGARQVYRLTSLDTPATGAIDVDLVDMLGSVDPHYAAVDDQLTLRLLVATLSPAERRILELRFFGQLTQTQIAAEIGVSQMQVSRLLKQTLDQLRAAALSTETAD